MVPGSRGVAVFQLVTASDLPSSCPTSPCKVWAPAPPCPARALGLLAPRVPDPTRSSSSHLCLGLWGPPSSSTPLPSPGTLPGWTCGAWVAFWGRCCRGGPCSLARPPSTSWSSSWRPFRHRLRRVSVWVGGCWHTAVGERRLMDQDCMGGQRGGDGAGNGREAG